MRLANTDIRRAIREGNLKFWEVAYRYGCTDTTFSKKLRRELSTEEKTKILEIIAELQKEAS